MVEVAVVGISLEEEGGCDQLVGGRGERHRVAWRQPDSRPSSKSTALSLKAVPGGRSQNLPSWVVWRQPVCLLVGQGRCALSRSRDAADASRRSVSTLVALSCHVSTLVALFW